jgi:hypothetical protein
VPPILAAGLLCAAVLAGRPGPAGPPGGAGLPAVQAAVVAAARAPVFFIENRGQRDPAVAFYAGGRQGQVAFGADGLRWSQTRRAAGPPAPGPRPAGSAGLDQAWLARLTRPPERQTVEARWLGARAGVRPAGRDPLPTRVSYLKGPRSAWRTGLPTYGRLVYADLWAGIDLEWAGTADGLKYTYVVRPGADPGRIRLAWSGAEAVTVGADGALEVGTRLGTLRDGRPIAYQLDGGRREPVAVAHAVAATGPETTAGADASGAAVSGFQVGAYDPGRPLYIDPVFPLYAGYLGYGEHDRGLGVATDSAGHAYFTGSLLEDGADFDDAYVARVSLDGGALDYLTILGGRQGEGSFDIAVDAAGSAYITGFTNSDATSFPVIGGPDLTFNGVVDVMVAKLAPGGEDLVFAGYLGGELVDFGESIRVDAAGDVYLHGPVLSTEATFPVKVGPDLSFNGETDGFVCKLRADPSAPEVLENLAYCGYLGGDATDIHMSLDPDNSFYSSGHLAIDADGAAYVSGETTSDESTFPDGDGFGSLPGPDQTQAGKIDGFLVKVRPDGGGFEHAGFIGGSGDDIVKGLAVAADGSAFVTGYTDSTEATLPVTVGPDLTYNGGDVDTLVVKVAPDGRSFGFLGYLGGAGSDGADVVVVDAEGRAHLAGYTDSGEDTFPVQVGPDLTQNDATAGAGDAFVARLHAEPSDPDPRQNLDFAGFIGGAKTDQAFWMALDPGGDMYVVGDTESDERSFPDGEGMGQLPSWERSFQGETDAFLIKLRFGDLPTPTPTASATEAPPSPTSDTDRYLAFLPLAAARAPVGTPRLAAAQVPGRSAGPLRGAAADRPPGRPLILSRPLRLAAAAAPGGGLARAAQTGGQETSFDDFCDFAVGWAAEHSDTTEARIATDSRLRCHYGILLRANTLYGSVSNGHIAEGEFALETTFDLDGRGGFAGLMFGVPATFSRYYIYAVSDSGAFILVVFENGQTRALAQGPAGLTSTRNIRLRAELRGDSIGLYANDELVSTVRDSGAHSGRVGVYAEWSAGAGRTLEARFDNIRIARLLPASAKPPPSP